MAAFSNIFGSFGPAIEIRETISKTRPDARVDLGQAPRICTPP